MYKKQWYEFDDNVAVVATTVASITTGISSFRQNNARRGRWFKLGFGLRVCGASASGGSGPPLAPAAVVAGVFQLPPLREPPQTTVREHLERHKRT